jgi:general secretion pathway protein D
VQPAPPAAVPAAPEAPKQPEAVQAAPVEPAPPVSGRAARPAGQPGGGPVSFFFDDADIFEVVQTVFGDILKVNYLIDQRVRGKVNFRTITPIPREEVLPVMETILRINGIGFVEEKGLYRIVPLTDVSKELVYAQVGKDPGNVAIELFAFKNMNIKESMPDIENMIGLNVQGGTVRIVPIQRLNALLVVSSTKEQMDYIRKWIEAFDGMFKEARPKVMVYPLQNSKAGHVASMLQSIIGGGGGGGISAPTPALPKASGTGATSPLPVSAPAPRTGATTVASGGGGSGFLVSPETKIFADEINNTLVILATPADYVFIEETIKKIDVLPRQVVIEGLLARVDLTDNLSFGFSWSLSTDLKISGIKPFVNPVNLAGDVQVNPQGFDLTKLPAQGFTFVGRDSKNTLRAVITALAQESKAKILAAPHILVSDNREARIQVGQQIPLATSTTTQPLGSTTTTTTVVPTVASTSTIQYKDIGIILKVKPQINDSGLVSLEVTQEVSSQGADVSIAGQPFASINKTEATTTLVAQDGETIIIGGLIREDVTKSKDGIPWLTKIPLLGNLFGTTTDNTTRAELIILLTPHVIKSTQDAASVTSDYVDKYKDTTKDKQIDQFIQERGQAGKGGGDADKDKPK